MLNIGLNRLDIRTIVFKRIQIDLIVMRNKPDEDYKWIAHVVDNFSQFHVMWAQREKSAVEVKNGLRQHWFAYFGLPSILQSDNGKEFKNKTVAELIDEWDDNCECIYGRPRHPQSQGLVKQSNGTAEMMIAAELKARKTTKWTELLPTIMFNLNTSVSSSTLFMLFEVLMNKKPNAGKNKHFRDISTDEESTPSQSTIRDNNQPRTSASVDSEAEESIDEESMNDDINSIRSQIVLNKEVSNRKMIEKHDL